MRRVHNDTTSTSQATRNLVTNPEMAAALSDKILFRNALTNPSFERASGSTTVHTNLLSNPGFETASATTNIWTNLVTNPSFEGTDTQVALWRNLATNPTFEAVSPGTAVHRTNLCINPNFDVALTGWTGQNLNAGYGRSSVRSVSGTHSFWGVASDTSGDSMLTNTAYITVASGKYTISAYAWVPGGVVASDFRNSNRNLWAVAWQGSSAIIASANLDFAKTNQWQRINTTITVPDGYTNLQIRLYCPANASGIHWDNVLVEQTDQLRPYFDGSTPDARGWDYAWTGTATASTSTAAATTAEIARNYAVNPSMAPTGTTVSLRRNLCLNPKATTPFPAYSSGTITAVSGIVGHPLGITTANRVTYGANTNNPGIKFFTPAANSMYTMSAWVYHETAPSSGSQAFAQDGVTSQPSPPAIVAKQWQRISWTFTTGSGTSDFGFRIGSPGSAGSFLITGILVEWDVPRVEEFFDGTTPAYQRVNLAHDPGATVYHTTLGKIGWRNSRWFGGGSGAGTYSLVTGASDGPVAGLTTYARKTWTVSGNTNGDTGFDHGYGSVNGIPVQGNKPYTVSSYLRANGVNKTGGNLQIIWYDAAGTLISQSYAPSNVALTQGVWVRLSNTATSPANASYMLAVSDCDSGTLWAPGESLDGTGLLVEQTDTLQSYFDGRVSTVPGTTYSWAGTANDSISFQYSSDYTYGWGTTENSSESAMRGVMPGDFTRSGGDSSQPHVVTDGYRKIMRYQYRTEGTAIALNSTATSANVSMLDKIYTVTAKVRSSIDLNGLRLRLGGANGPSFDLIAGQWKTVSFTAIHPNTGYTSVWSPALAPGQYGAHIDVAEFAVIEGTYKGNFFDGSTPSEGDFSYAWVGTPNNSQSIKRAVKGLNIGASRNSATADTQFYSYSAIEGDQRFARYLTPAGSAASSWRIANSSGLEYGNIVAGETYSLYVKYRVSGWTNPTVMFGLKDATAQNTVSPDWTVTNVPSGWQTLNQTFVASINGLNTTQLYISLPASAPANNDAIFDVEEWYLVPGTYTGPTFDGVTPSANDLTYSWAGTVDNSASIAYGNNVTGVSNGNVKSHQSTEWGRMGKSVKIIPIDVAGSTATSVALPVTLTAGKTYTVLGTRYLDKPLVGTLNSAYGGKIALVQPGLATLSPTTALPNVAGEATLRWTFTVDPAATGHTLRLGHGGNVNSGNVWWDDILVVEGTYTGPYFDGSRPAKDNLARSAATAYNGTVHTANVSFAGQTWTRTTAPAGIGSHLTRQLVDKNYLILGETYTASVTVANDQSTSQTVTIDWCDTGSTSFTIQPGEIRRISTSGSRPRTGNWVYGDVYRFADMHLTASATEDRSLLFKDWVIELGTTSGEYYSGTGDYTYAWNGPVNASTSSQNALGIKEWGHLTGGRGTICTTTPSKFGTKCAEVSTKGTNGDGIYGNGVDVVPSTTYRSSAWIRITSTVTQFWGVLRFKDTAGNIVFDASTDVSSLLRVGEWVRVTLTGLAPANAATVQPLWRIYANHTPTTFFVDGAIITESALDVEYFDGATPAYQNLLTNPSFETATSPWGANTTNYSLVRDTTVGRSALGSAKVTVLNQSTGDINTYSSRTPAKAGDVFTASAWVKASVAKTLSIRLDWRNPGANTISMSQGNGVVGTDWTRISVTGTAPAGTDSLFIRVGSDTPQDAGFIYWVDDVVLEKSGVLREYYTGTGDFSYSWVGTANDSKSIKTAPTAATMSGNYASRIAWQSSGGPVPGKKSVAVLSGTPNVDTFAQFEGTLPFTGENLGGRTFTILATRKTVNDLPASGNDGRAWKFLWQVTKADGSIVQIMPPVGPTTAGIHKVKHTFTFDADTNTTTAFIRLYNGSATPNTTVWWDDVAIIEGAYPDEYFDGSTTDTSDFTYEWVGTENTSASTVRAWNVAGSHTSMRAQIYSSSVAPFSGASSAKGIVSEVGYQPRYEILFAVKPNRIYTAMAKMRASTGPVHLSMKWITNPDTQVPIISESASNNKWTTVRNSSVSPAGATHLALWVGVPTNTALGTVFDIDQVMLVEGDYNGPFGTGDSYGWTWEGVPHASTSIGYPVGLRQLAGPPLFIGSTAGTYILTNVDATLNPVLLGSSPRTIYSIVDILQDLPTGTLSVISNYGAESLSDVTDPNRTLMTRLQSANGDGNAILARRTGGSGPVSVGVPATGKHIMITGMNEDSKFFSGYNKSALAVEGAVMDIPHEKIMIYADNQYHKHIATYIYPGVHSAAVRQEMVKLLAHEYAIPGM